ncbi:MAG: hypothetical protein CNE99_07820 [OM182 bacterium MED-G24]|uniref:Uncharacterized protein n=1 Tax=OM182 bacterium MED-G24 TaxID=1986255 RepID=A0A2A5WNL2_9GAMM|nr:MAG: hypothetical protein CNE99_07820 [OM182 bacterium MED-G24]
MRDRFFRGHYRHNDQLPAVVDLFLSQKAEILKLVDTSPMSTSSRRRTSECLIRFFNEVEGPGLGTNAWFAPADPDQFNRLTVVSMLVIRYSGRLFTSREKTTCQTTKRSSMR